MSEKVKKSNYTQEEIDFIHDNAGNYPIDWIARRLGRGVSGVRIQMVAMGVSNFQAEAGTYSAHAFSELIGVSDTTVRRWIKNKGLPSKKGSRFEKNNKSWSNHHHITPEDFWKWAENHKKLIRFNLIEKDILPPEPAWVDEERKKQFYSPPKRQNWTVKDDAMVWNLYYSGMKLNDIAQKMNRTRPSIEKRLKRLRESGYGRQNA